MDHHDNRNVRSLAPRTLSSTIDRNYYTSSQAALTAEVCDPYPARLHSVASVDESSGYCLGPMGQQRAVSGGTEVSEVEEAPVRRREWILQDSNANSPGGRSLVLKLCY